MLSEFIRDNLEPILAEWERFARSIPSAAEMDTVALRDHAEAILRTVAADLARTQTDAQQRAKSKGNAPQPATEEDTAAEVHGGGRQLEGFSLSEMVSEYRALRASVIRLWTRELGSADGEALDDMTRFNEAIDQALTESTAYYSERLERSRGLMLGALGHDLRGPLGAVLSSGHYLTRSEGLSPPQLKAASLVVRSATRIGAMIADLLDLTRTRLGATLPISPAPIDLGAVCAQVIEEARASHAEREITFRAAGPLEGEWDRSRLGQLVGNLVGNAIQYGVADRPVAVSAEGDAGTVTLSVHNAGKEIPSSSQRSIFEPLARGEELAAPGSGLGLGLYIVREIARAHGGTVEVRSSKGEGTTFTVRLPRRAASGGR